MREVKRSRPLRVESLESREVLSTLALTAPRALSAEVIHAESLHFTTHGVYTTTQGLPDTGSQYRVLTSGRFLGFANVTVSGILNAPALVTLGELTGNLTAHSRFGNLTMSVTGASNTVFYGGLPSSLTFRITGGTGVFAHYHTGQGTIAATWTPNPAGSIDLEAGKVSLVFRAT